MNQCIRAGPGDGDVGGTVNSLKEALHAQIGLASLAAFQRGYSVFRLLPKSIGGATGDESGNGARSQRPRCFCFKRCPDLCFTR